MGDQKYLLLSLVALPQEGRAERARVILSCSMQQREECLLHQDVEEKKVAN